MRSDKHSRRLGRRAFLQNGTLLLAAAGTGDAASLFAAEDRERLRVGLVTDMHHADKPAAGVHWANFVSKFGERGVKAPVCVADYNTFFQEAVAIIDQTCIINPG